MNWFIQYLCIVAAGSAPMLERAVAMTNETMREFSKCPWPWSPCGDQSNSDYCINGICCEIGPASFCVCDKCFTGPRCHRRNCTIAASGFEGVHVVTAALGSILAILLVCGLVAAVFLIIKYCKNRKDQCQDDQEIKKSMLSSPEFGEVDEAFTKMMMTQPGQHHWKQNVKLMTHDSSKMKDLPSSNAFPWLQIEWTERSVKKANQTKTKEAADEGNKNSSLTSQLLLD